jgi:hypothetical protein
MIRSTRVLSYIRDLSQVWEKQNPKEKHPKLSAILEYQYHPGCSSFQTLYYCFLV